MDSEESSIERLKRTLYSRNEKIVPKERRTPVSPTDESGVPTDFGAPPNFAIPLEEGQGKNSFFNRFLIVSVLFFVVALAVAGFVFFGGFNTISANNVDIKITAPTSVASGEELDADLAVVNSNPTDLTGVTLYIDYPDGAQALDPSAQAPTHDQINLGTIARGASSDYTIRTILLGQKGTLKDFTLRLEYQVKGSSATFSKQKVYEVAIGSSPLLLTADAPSEISSGDTLTLSIVVASNSTTVVQNSLIKVTYPFGFTYKTSNIKPVVSNPSGATWNLGDLKGGDNKTLAIVGTLVGQDSEDRSFTVSAGTQSSSNPPDFDTPLATTLTTVGIRKSFFGLGINTNGTVSSGQSTPISVTWQNTLPDPIINSSIQATISGNDFDRGSVSAQNGGFFQSVNNTIVWDQNSDPDLKSISPGDTGQVSFALGALPQNNIQNPHIDLHIVMTGNRTGSDTSLITSLEDVTIKIPTTLSLSSKLYRFGGPFTNTGPVPPKADTETTYTAVWTVTNTANNLSGATVSAVLPAGVAWKGQSSPQSETVMYDNNSRTVSWNLTAVSAGVGFTNSARQVSFQLGITPSVNQIGSTPVVLGESDASGYDTYASTTVRSVAPNLTTLFSDSSFRPGQDIVAK